MTVTWAGLASTWSGLGPTWSGIVPAMAVDVYDVDNTTFLGTLQEAFGIAFIDDLLIPGSATFQVDAASTADVALLQPRRVVRFRTGPEAGDSDVFAAVVQDREATLDDAVQPPSGGNLSTITYNCPGLLSQLGYSTGGAVLYPYGGLADETSNPLVNSIYDLGYDDSTWGTPTIGTPKTPSTAGWPDPSAAVFEPEFPGSRSTYRRVVTGTGEVLSGRMYMVASSDTKVNVFINGVRVLSKPAGFSGLFDQFYDYDGGDQVVVIEASGKTGRVAWTWQEIDGSGANVGTIRRTFENTDFPEATPWTVWSGSVPLGASTVRRPASRQQNPRIFGWFAPDFDDTGWGPPQVGGAVSTAGWPDDQAVAYQSIFEGERSLWRRTMPSGIETAGPARMYLVATVQTEVTVYLDTEVVLTKPRGKSGLFFVDVPYEDTEHLVAIETSGGRGRFAWSWIRLIEAVDDDGNDVLALGAVIRRTFDPAVFPLATPWKSFEGDIPVPGVTVGYVLNTALTEDQGRNPGRPWTWDFTAATDSAGQPWEAEFARGFRMQEVGRLVDELSSIEGEPEMTPAGVFRMFGRRGTDRTGSVSITSPYGLRLSGRGPQATRWLFETSAGMGEIVNVQAEQSFGVMEQFVQLGNDVSPEAIEASLTAQLQRDGAVLDEVDVDLPDTVVPYDTVFLGDTVTCVGRDGTGPVRLTSFEMTLADDGTPIWSATATPEVT